MRIETFRRFAPLVFGALALPLSTCASGRDCSTCGAEATAVEHEAHEQGAASPAASGTPISKEDALAAFDTAWQTINDTHFDPTFNGVDWAAVKEEFRPKVEEAGTKERVRELIDEMLTRLGQSHFAVIPSEALPDSLKADSEPGEDIAGSLGFDVRLRADKVLVSDLDQGGPAEAAGVRLGWILVEVDGEKTSELLEDLREYGEKAGPRMLAFTLRELVSSKLTGSIGSKAELVFLDQDDSSVELELERVRRDVVAHSFGTALPTFYLRFQSDTFQRQGKSIGWIHFTNWFLPMMKPIDEAVDRMRASDGIVIDLRGNSGGAGAMTMGVAGHFFSEQRELGVMQMRESKMNFLAMPRKLDTQGNLVEPFHGPVAIVIDETSGSASEVFAGGMQSTGRARVFGETSAGAVLPATMTKLPDGDALLHAFGDFVTSDGTRLEGRGVIPDEVVPLDRASLLTGEDRQLEAALAWIVSQKNS